MPGPLPPDQKRAAPTNGTSLVHPASYKHGDSRDPAVTTGGFAAMPASPCCDAALHPGRQSGMPSSEISGTQERQTHGCSSRLSPVYGDAPGARG